MYLFRPSAARPACSTPWTAVTPRCSPPTSRAAPSSTPPRGGLAASATGTAGGEGRDERVTGRGEDGGRRGMVPQRVGVVVDGRGARIRRLQTRSTRTLSETSEREVNARSAESRLDVK